MSKKSSVFDTIWFVCGQPLGDGTLIYAGSEDPNAGQFVCDTESHCDDEHSNRNAQLIARHIANAHNKWLFAKSLDDSGVRQIVRMIQEDLFTKINSHFNSETATIIKEMYVKSIEDVALQLVEEESKTP